MVTTTEAPSHRKAVDWRDFIHSDPTVLVGKPVVRGTRLSVDFILRLFGNGWTLQEVLENYPRLTAETVQAVFAYAGNQPVGAAPPLR